MITNPKQLPTYFAFAPWRPKFSDKTPLQLGDNEISTNPPTTTTTNQPSIVITNINRL